MHKQAPLKFVNRSEWHMWLVVHHATESEVWVIHYKKKYQDEGLTLDDAVEEALCFGWIDSTLNTVDEKRYALRYTPRKQNSIWSMSNITRAEKLIAEGRMTGAGLEKITEAQENGQWEAAIQREDVDTIPEMLLHALEEEGALTAYQALPSSRKKQYLYWLNTAKQEQTKNRRIQKIIDALMSR